MSNLNCGTMKKFTVVKDDDIREYLSEEEQEELRILLFAINRGREKDGRKTNNEYLVINIDESYSKDIIDILKKNGHWG